MEKLYAFKNIRRDQWTEKDTDDFCFCLKDTFWSRKIDPKGLTSVNIGDMLDYILSHQITKGQSRFESEFRDGALDILNFIKSA